MLALKSEQDGTVSKKKLLLPVMLLFALVMVGAVTLNTKSKKVPALKAAAELTSVGNDECTIPWVEIPHLHVYGACPHGRAHYRGSKESKGECLDSCKAFAGATYCVYYTTAKGCYVCDWPDLSGPIQMYDHRGTAHTDDIISFRKCGGETCQVNIVRHLAPVIHFDFTSTTNPLTDKVAGLVMALHNGANVNPSKKAVEVRAGQYGMTSNVIWPGGALTDNTISVWARLSGLAAKGGAAVSIDQKYHPSGYVVGGFDAIVWGEYNAKNQWQPGSDYGRRWAPLNANTGPSEMAPHVLRLLTLVNDKQNGRLKFYVDGAKVLDYAVTNPYPTYGSESRILLNYRHSPHTTTCDFDIYDVKVFNQVLVDSEVQQLFTNKPLVV